MNLKAKNHLISVEELLGEFQKRADSGLINSFDDVEDLIMEMPERDAWISCDDRLPEINEHHCSDTCVVYCKGGAYALTELQENIFGEVGWACERSIEYYPDELEVIAWMPLSEPYKIGFNECLAKIVGDTE